MYYKEPKSKLGGVNNVAYYLPRAMKQKANVSYFPRTMSPKKASNLFNVYGKYAAKQFDIIQFNSVPMWNDGSFMLLRFAKIMGIRTFLNIHGIIPLEHKLDPGLGPISQSDLMFTVTSCKLVDRIIANTKFMRSKIAALYGVNSDKIVVIPNGINLAEFSECVNKIPLEGNPVILTVGYFSRLKGFDILAEAIAQLRLKLPNLKLHVVGAGYSSYLPMLNKMGIADCVVFHGMVEHSQVCRYFKSADICVIPSRHEGFPITLLEAMSSGIPIIASNIGSLKEIISDGEDGLLFQTENPRSLADSILNLAADSSLRKKISYNALKTARKYGWQNVANSYLELYQSVS